MNVFKKCKKLIKEVEVRNKRIQIKIRNKYQKRKENKCVKIIIECQQKKGK